MPSREAYDYSELARKGAILSKGHESRVHVRMDFDALRTFRDALEGFVASEDARITSNYNGPPEDYEGWWLEDIVGEQLRRSFVAACVEATWFHLEHICGEVAAITRGKLPSFKSRIFENAREFLTEKGKFKVPAEVWQDVGDLVALRNACVHGKGLLPVPGEDRHSELSRLVTAPGCSLSGSYLVLNAEFTTYAHGRCVKLFDAIHEELSALCLGGHEVQPEVS